MIDFASVFQFTGCVMIVGAAYFAGYVMPRLVAWLDREVKAFEAHQASQRIASDPFIASCDAQIQDAVKRHGKVAHLRRKRSDRLHQLLSGKAR